MDIGLSECISAIIKKNEVYYFKIPDKEKRIDLSNVVFFESSNHSILIKMQDNQDYIFYDKLNNIEKDIDSRDFLRVHQSYLVNIRYIKTLDRYSLILLDGSAIPVSRRNYKKVKDKLMIEGVIL